MQCAHQHAGCHHGLVAPRPAAARPCLKFNPLGRHYPRRAAAASADAGEPKSTLADSSAMPENFCIIEGRDAVKDFANMPADEIRVNIANRRDKIFLLMEELRRLRIQQRLKGVNEPARVEIEQQKYLSALPFLPPLTEKSLTTYYTIYGAFFGAVILFGALLAPLLEVRIGLGGTSYMDFIHGLHLPEQLAEVDPIVASFCGGAVGAVSALLVVEINNIKQQIHNRCHYCQGAGYLTCGHCVGSGTDPASRESCAFCAGSGKVMCTGCLCTGKQMATEHDPRIDPFT
ncbi:hypothetical protein OEZ85_014158 [Tetradesmus obliquus]|uniref:Uncharacterized protein n=1 Tax=Tetradesmus obliquus TaxID=3088 RepID=A0ABY8U7E8_TETOB|nr:hypothetical protein OEZ85_014158 [Tetradesmus obliquus]